MNNFSNNSNREKTSNSTICLTETESNSFRKRKIIYNINLTENDSINHTNSSFKRSNLSLPEIKLKKQNMKKNKTKNNLFLNINIKQNKINIYNNKDKETYKKKDNKYFKNKTMNDEKKENKNNSNFSKSKTFYKNLRSRNIINKTNTFYDTFLTEENNINKKESNFYLNKTKEHKLNYNTFNKSNNKETIKSIKHTHTIFIKSKNKLKDKVKISIFNSDSENYNNNLKNIKGNNLIKHTKSFNIKTLKNSLKTSKNFVNINYQQYAQQNAIFYDKILDLNNNKIQKLEEIDEKLIEKNNKFLNFFKRKLPIKKNIYQFQLKNFFRNIQSNIIKKLIDFDNINIKDDNKCNIEKFFVFNSKDINFFNLIYLNKSMKNIIFFNKNFYFSKTYKDYFFYKYFDIIDLILINNNLKQKENKNNLFKSIPLSPKNSMKKKNKHVLFNSISFSKKNTITFKNHFTKHNKNKSNFKRLKFTHRFLIRDIKYNLDEIPKAYEENEKNVKNLRKFYHMKTLQKKLTKHLKKSTLFKKYGINLKKNDLRRNSFLYITHLKEHFKKTLIEMENDSSNYFTKKLVSNLKLRKSLIESSPIEKNKEILKGSIINKIDISTKKNRSKFLSPSKQFKSNKDIVIFSTTNKYITQIQTEKIKNKELINIGNNLYKIICFYICENNENEVITVIKENLEYINLNYVNSDGNTFLNLSVKNNCNYNIIKFLLEKGSNPNKCDFFGNSPLHIALSNKNFKIANLLILYNANELLVNKKGLTPWQCLKN